MALKIRHGQEKPLPSMPIVETSSVSSSSVSSSSNLPYQQQHQYFSDAPPAATTAGFAQGKHFFDSNSNNSNNSIHHNGSLPRRSLDHAPPPYSFAAGDHGSTIISTGPPPPTEEQLFQVKELSPGPLGLSLPSNSSTLNSSVTGSSTLSSITAHLQSTQYICADPMHDQQYLLVGSNNALHSIDLTFSNHHQQQQQQSSQQGGVISSNSTGGVSGGSSAGIPGNVVRTHIQGLAFKEIHCLEEIGLVVVIAGRNSRVRCYDYDSINRLVAFGHSAQSRGRVIDGSKLGAMKNMIQLKVETALVKADDTQSNSTQDGSHSSPSSGTTGVSVNQGLRGTGTTSPTITTANTGEQRQHRHQHSASLDRSLLSPPILSDSPGLPLESIRDDQEMATAGGAVPPSCTTSQPSSTTATIFKKQHKQRPLSFGGLASLASEHVMRKSTPKDPSDNNANKSTTNQSSSTPTSPSSAMPSGGIIGGNGISGANPTKNKRFLQMASYLSQAAASANITSPQDGSMDEAVAWAWDFTKLKQTKDVLGLDFHYTTTTVFMTVTSKTAIDIYCRPRSARGRKAPTPSGGSNLNHPSSRMSYSGSETSGRPSISSIGGSGGVGGMAAISPDNNPHYHRDYNQDPYEWKLYKQLYHPEPPSFMTVVKGPNEVTDIVLGKGPRACVISVEDKTVTDLHRQETSSVIHGLGKKLGFRNTSLWHSFEKIPFDVPPHILFPAAAEAMYGNNERRKETYSRSFSNYSGGNIYQPTTSSASGGTGSGHDRRSRDNILQRPADQQIIHQQELEEQERDEAAHALALKLQNTQLQGKSNLGVPHPLSHLRSSSPSPPSSATSSNSSSSVALATQPQLQPQPSSSIATSIPTTKTTTSGAGTPGTKTKTRMVTSDEVLNLAFTQRTMGQLFLATYGSHSRIVDLHGKPQSRIVLDWENLPPQKVEFLKTVHDIYVVGFEKSAIVIFSLTRAKKVKEITKYDLIQATNRAQTTSVSVNGQSGQRYMYDGTQPHHFRSHSPQPPTAAATATTTTSTASGVASSNSSPSTGASASPSLPATAMAFSNATSSSSSLGSSAYIKFLGRDSMAEDSLGLFFSYFHPKNGVSICQLAVVPLLAANELELIGYYP
ncbi:hypothetical protein FBU30_009212 [Linnemannia zychae]|nr:hypothetical protein FBU30_009212 [Linnemannia zychae]